MLNFVVVYVCLISTYFFSSYKKEKWIKTEWSYSAGFSDMNKEVTSNSGSLPDVRLENETSNGQIALSNEQVATLSGRKSSQTNYCDSSSYDSDFIVSIFHLKN